MKRFINKQTLIPAAIGLMAGGVLVYLNSAFDGLVRKVVAKVDATKL